MATAAAVAAMVVVAAAALVVVASMALLAVGRWLCAMMWPGVCACL